MHATTNQRKTAPILKKTVEPEREEMVSVSNHIDPEVTKIAHQIHDAIEKHKPIKPSGTSRPQYDPNKNPSPAPVDIEKEAITVDMLDANTLEEIKKIAARYPLTKDLMTQAKQYFQVNQKVVNKQMEDLVALYSIKDKKPFFFISPSEARIAIDYVKKVRSGFLQEQEETQIQDLIVRHFMSQIPYLTAENKNEKEMQRIIHDKMDLTKKNAPLPISYFQDSNPNFIGPPLSLSAINYMFAFMENMTNEGLTVDTLIMSALRHGDIRNMGRTVFEEATAKDAKERGIFAHLFTADIYICNALGNDKIVTGNSSTNTFVLHVLQQPKNNL